MQQSKRPSGVNAEKGLRAAEPGRRQLQSCLSSGIKKRCGECGGAAAGAQSKRCRTTSSGIAGKQPRFQMRRDVAQTDSQRVLGKSDNEKLRYAVT